MLAALSLAIAIGVAAGWHPRMWLSVSIALNLAYWVLGQSLGGIFAGGATDPNTGPLFVLLGLAMLPLVAAGPPSASEDTTRAGRVRSEPASP